MVERQFSERATRDIAEVVRHFKRNGGQQTSNNPMPPGRYRPMEGKLTSALSATEGSTAIFDVWSVVDGNWEATGESYTITNHSGGISGAVDDYVLVASVSGKLRPILVVDSDGNVNGGGGSGCDCHECAEEDLLDETACSATNPTVSVWTFSGSGVSGSLEHDATCTWEEGSTQTYGSETGTWTLTITSRDPGGVALTLEPSSGTTNVTYLNTHYWSTGCTNEMRAVDLHLVADDDDRELFPCTICVKPIGTDGDCDFGTSPAYYKVTTGSVSNSDSSGCDCPGVVPSEWVLPNIDDEFSLPSCFWEKVITPGPCSGSGDNSITATLQPEESDLTTPVIDGLKPHEHILEIVIERGVNREFANYGFASSTAWDAFATHTLVLASVTGTGAGYSDQYCDWPATVTVEPA